MGASPRPKGTPPAVGLSPPEVLPTYTVPSRRLQAAPGRSCSAHTQPLKGEDGLARSCAEISPLQAHPLQG